MSLAVRKPPAEQHVAEKAAAFGLIEQVGP